MGKHLKRLTAMVLTAAMTASLIPQAALAAAADTEIPIYTEELIRALADAIAVPEGAENGVFSFAAQAYAMRRSGSDITFPVLRGGPCEGEAEVALHVADISATYGIDYVLKINGVTLDAQEDTVQLVATEDKHDPGAFLLTEEYLLDAENEMAQEEAAPLPEEAAPAEQPASGDDAGRVGPGALARENAGEMSLHDMKEELFGRELEQTDSFYGDSPSVAFSMDDMAASLTSVLPREIADLSGVNTVLRFEAGERYKMITVKLLKNGTSAGDESFCLSLSDGTEGTLLGEYASVTVALEHEGELEQSVIGISNTDVDPQSSTAEVTVTREKGEYNAAVVSFSTASGTMVSGEDYSPVSETLIFMPGETEKTITIPILSAKGGEFSCVLSDPRGASLSNETATVRVEQLLTGTVYASNNSDTETHSFREFGEYARNNSYMFQRDGDYNIENYHSKSERDNYGIAKLWGKDISGAAYSKVTLHFNSDAEFANRWYSGWYTMTSRQANTVTSVLWRDGYFPYALDTGAPDDTWNPQNAALSDGAGIYSGWQHSGNDPQRVYGLTQTIDIPNDRKGDVFTYTVQHQHKRDDISRGSVHIEWVELTPRRIRFQYLPHDPFYRRIRSLTNTEPVDNIFRLVSNGKRGESTTYVIGDPVRYGVEGAAKDDLYEYMASVARSMVSDGISASVTGENALTLPSNYGFDLTDRFFERYGKAFTPDGNSSNKVAYIKPAYNKERWKAQVYLKQTSDGTAELGFLDQNDKIVSLLKCPAYLSEKVVLRMTPKPGLYAKGYRMEYRDYDGVIRYATYELGEGELERDKTQEMTIPVRYPYMSIKPLYTSLPERRITITVNEATRQYGRSYPEGVQEAVLDAQGNRVSQLEMGMQMTEYATAKEGYVPVWTRNGVRYSGETYDFEIDKDDIRIVLSFEKEGAVTHTITGTLREPKITINNILGTNFGEDAPKGPLTGAEVATGRISSRSNSDGAFTLNNVYSVAGTRRTVRVVRGGEAFVYEVAVPASGSASMGTLDLPLTDGLPYKVSGTMVFNQLDEYGHMNTYESDFGGIGQDQSSLLRYDAEAKDVNGSVRFLGKNNTYGKCELIFTDKEGIEVSRIHAEKDPSGDFKFKFSPVVDTRAGGGMYLSLTDNDGNIYGPYDTGIKVSDPPNGDTEKMEGPTMEIPTKDIELPIVRMTRPNFSTGVFESSTGLTMVVGFDVRKIASAIRDARNLVITKKVAEAITAKAKQEAANSTSKQAQKTSGSATATIDSVGFAATFSFAYFDKDGKVLPEKEEGAILALYNILFYVGASGRARKEFNTSIYGVPVYAELSGGASVAVFASLSAVDEKGKKSHFPMETFLEDPTDLKVEGCAPISLELGLEAGVGKKQIAAVFIDGKMLLDLSWFLWDSGQGRVAFSAGGGVYVVGQKIGFDYKFEPISLFSYTKASPALVFSRSEEEQVKTGIDAVQTPHFDVDFSQIMKGPSQAQTATLLEGVLHDAHPRIVDIGSGKTMLVFLADAPGRNGVNSSGLYYSVFDGATVTQPVLIDDDDSTLDAAPDVMDLGDKVLIVWSDARSDSFGETADVRDIMASMDISGVLYDKASGTMGQKFSVTSDSQGTNHTYYLSADTQPTICYNEQSGNVGVYYLKEDFGLLMTGSHETVNDFMNGRSTVAFCPIDVNAGAVSRAYLPDENVPERFQAALNGQRLLDVGVSSLSRGLSDPKIETFAVDSVGGYTVFAYPVDLDQSGATTDDQALFAVLIDQATGKKYAPVCLTDTASAINSLSFVKQQVEADGEAACLHRLVWQSDGNLLCCDMDDLLGCVTLGEDGSCTLSEDFSVASYVAQNEEEPSFGNEAMFAAAPDGGVFGVTTGMVGTNNEIFVRYCPGEFTRETLLDGTTNIAEHGQWSGAVQITRASQNGDAGRHILLKDVAAADDGSLLILCDRFEGAADTGNLQLIRVTPSPSLKSGIAVTSDQAYPRAGDTVLLAAALESDGLRDSEDVTVDFSLVDGNGTSTPIGSWTGDVPAGGSAQAVIEWTVTEELPEGCKVVASAGRSTGELTDLTGEAVALENISCRYLSAGGEQGKDTLAVSTTILNQGNETPRELTLQICSVDRDAFGTGLDGADAYTVVSDTKIVDPFENADYLSGEYEIELAPSEDGMPRELMVRVLTKDGELCDSGVEFISVMPPEDKAPLREKPEAEDPGDSGDSDSDSSGESSTYAITVEKAEHGSVKSSRTRTDAGNTVTLTVLPDNGYELNTLTVTDRKGKEVRLTAKDNGKYTFVMPHSAVTVKAGFAPIPDDGKKPCDGGAACLSHKFADLGGVDVWYHEAVDYALKNGLMNGCGNGLFEPDSTLSRAQLAQILYNKEGKPAVTGDSVFADVGNGQWYASAINWAAANGIVTGYGSGLFGPEDNITREQLAVMLWRYAGSPAAAGKELGFTDADQAGDFAGEALYWAVEKHIVNGCGDGRLDPKGPATRAQAAQMLKNFIER